MYMIVLRILWPFLQRYLASYAADYLENRRAARQALKENLQLSADCPPCPPVSTSPAASTNNPLWYALSGILLGSALGTILYVFWKDANTTAEFEL